MTRTKMITGAVILFLFLTIIPMIGNAETEKIGIEDPETPLKGEPNYIETGTDGNLLIISYKKNLGISIINRNDNTIKHFTEPEISSNKIHKIHYNEDDNVLFAVTDSGYSTSRSTLDIIWLSNDTIGRVILDHYGPTINDLEYHGSTNTLYLACNAGLWIIDVDSLEITTKLDKGSGLPPGGVSDLFQEETEGLLWFLTSWTEKNMNILTLDMSTNTISPEIFNVTDIAIRNGYTPIRPGFTLLYDKGSRDIFVSLHFNITSTGEIFYLACFDRDDTSNFVPLPTGYISEGREVTRSDDYEGWRAVYILGMYSRNKKGFGPYFSGTGIGLFYIDPPLTKISTSDEHLTIKTHVKTVRRPVVRFDPGSEKYIDIELDFDEPEYDQHNDIAVETDSTTAIVSGSDGITVIDTDDMKEPQKPDPKRRSGIFLAEYYANGSEVGKILNFEENRKENVRSDGHIEILTKGFAEDDPVGRFYIGRSLLTITDSKGNEVLNRETGGSEIDVELQLSDLQSSEYTIRFERTDWIGNLVDYEECKFVLDNPDQPSDEKKGSKLGSLAIPIAGALAGVLVLIALIVIVSLALVKKTRDSIPKEIEEE